MKWTWSLFCVAGLSALLLSCLDTGVDVQVYEGPSDKCETATHCGDGICDKQCAEDLPGEEGCAADCCLCGDGACNTDLCGEAWKDGMWTCALDCAECGNETCDPGEGPVKCAVDCCGACGDGHCVGTQCGEDPQSCPQDCEKFACGNGLCEPVENPITCLEDCEPYACGNGTCEPGETPEACPDDCSFGCGDCVCEGDETYLVCPADCGYCGDGYCIANCPEFPESPENCYTDCCLPDCAGRECGDDGCGGTCGKCSWGSKCNPLGICGICVPECHNRECGPDGCGHVCGECPEQGICIQGGKCACVPGCQNRECGNDGCGGKCGDCPLKASHCNAGICECFPICGGKKCGSDGCGGLCGLCTGNHECEDGTCICYPDCQGRECGSDGCSGDCGDCSTLGTLAWCNMAGACQCLPDCDDKDCGLDGCGGSCGQCHAPHFCDAGVCVCQPQCTDKNCGPDGCGETCGECNIEAGEVCTEDQTCFCFADCYGKNCGDDGCGGSCGDCAEGLGCVDGICACSPDCGMKICGSDGCNGTCGVCPDGMNCENGGCVQEGGQCYDGNSIPWDGCASGTIAEYRINQYYGKDQQDPVVVTVEPTSAPFEEGGFIIAWQGVSQEDSGGGVVMRMFDQKGIPVSGDIQLNSVEDYAQKAPALLVFEDGPIVAVWHSFEGPETGFDIRVRRFSLDGTPLAEEIVVNSHVAGDQLEPRIAGFSDKAFVVVWEGAGPEAPSAVYARVFAADGTPWGEQFVVSQDPANGQNGPAVAALNGDNFVVVWEGNDADGDNEGILGRVFSPEPTALTGAFVVNTYTLGTQDLAAVAALPSGGFCAAWHVAYDGGSFHEIYGQRFAGGPTYGQDGTEIHYNSYTGNNQTAPAMSARADDGLIVFWQSQNSQTDEDYGIYGQTFSDNDAPDLGEELHANTETSQNQRYPSVARFDNGNFIVVWESEDQADGYDIYAQRYLPEGKKLYR